MSSFGTWRGSIPRTAPKSIKQNRMKQTLIALAIIAISAIQGLCIGLNGLTIISIPITIYLGLLVIEKVTETEEQLTK